MFITVLIFVLIIVFILIFIRLLVLIVEIKPISCTVNNRHTAIILQRLTVFYSQILVHIITLSLLVICILQSLYLFNIIWVQLCLQSIQVLFLLSLAYLFLTFWRWYYQIYSLIEVLILTLVSKYPCLQSYIWPNKKSVNTVSSHLLRSMNHIVA